MMKKVSIVIPVYNVSQFIERCVRSVINQDYPCIECILVDDNSQDDSVFKIESILASYHGPISFRILHQAINQGQSAARNVGTKVASGDYVYYLDSDDEITTNCISTLVSETLKCPEAELICADCYEDGIQRVFHFNEYSHLTNNLTIRYQLFCPEQKWQIVPWNKLIDIKFIRKNKINFIEGCIHEDILWNYDIITKLNNLVIIPEKTYWYHLNHSSTVESPNKRRSSLSRAAMAEIIVKSLTEPLFNLALYKYLLRLFGYYRNLSTNDYQPTAKAFSRALWINGEKKISIAVRLYFKWSRLVHMRKFEKILIDKISNRYNREDILAQNTVQKTRQII